LLSCALPHRGAMAGYHPVLFTTLFMLAAAAVVVLLWAYL
jgi:hypothetical protein